MHFWHFNHHVFFSLELGKNINQDKILNLKRYAEGYHEFIKSMNFEEAEPETGETKRQKRGE